MEVILAIVTSSVFEISLFAAGITAGYLFVGRALYKLLPPVIANHLLKKDYETFKEEVTALLSSDLENQDTFDKTIDLIRNFDKKFVSRLQEELNAFQREIKNHKTKDNKLEVEKIINSETIIPAYLLYRFTSNNNISIADFKKSFEENANGKIENFGDTLKTTKTLNVRNQLIKILSKDSKKIDNFIKTLSKSEANRFAAFLKPKANAINSSKTNIKKQDKELASLSEKFKKHANNTPYSWGESFGVAMAATGHLMDFVSTRTVRRTLVYISIAVSLFVAVATGAAMSSITMTFTALSLFAVTFGIMYEIALNYADLKSKQENNFAIIEDELAIQNMKLLESLDKGKLNELLEKYKANQATNNLKRVYNPREASPFKQALMVVGGFSIEDILDFGIVATYSKILEGTFRGSATIINSLPIPTNIAPVLVPTLTFMKIFEYHITLALLTTIYALFGEDVRNEFANKRIKNINAQNLQSCKIEKAFRGIDKTNLESFKKELIDVINGIISGLENQNVVFDASQKYHLTCAPSDSSRIFIKSAHEVLQIRRSNLGLMFDAIIKTNADSTTVPLANLLSSLNISSDNFFYRLFKPTCFDKNIDAFAKEILNNATQVSSKDESNLKDKMALTSFLYSPRAQIVDAAINVEMQR